MNAPRPEPNRVPRELWLGMVKHGVTPSMNLVFDDGDGHFLFLERANEPAKGLLWVPGGRFWNGETRKDAVERIAKEELGIRSDLLEILHVSDRSNDEIWTLEEMGDPEAARERYGDGVKSVHYHGGVAYVRAKGGRPEISVDAQSARHEWLRGLPENPHPYLRWYFEAVADEGFPVPRPEGE